jgi:hypothetical protein
MAQSEAGGLMTPLFDNERNRALALAFYFLACMGVAVAMVNRW